MARSNDFDLAKELAKPSFTPAQRDAPALVELVVKGDEPASGRAAIALAKLAAAGRTAVLERLVHESAPADVVGAGAASADPGTAPMGDGGTARLVGVLGLLARGGDADARGVVIARVGDPAVRVRRAAIGALGKLDGDDVRAVVIARWDAQDVPPDERRTLAEALGKLGGDAAISRLKQTISDDSELARRRDRGLLMAERTAKREEGSEVRIDVAPATPLQVRLGCKAGLAELLVEELRSLQLPGLGQVKSGVFDAVELELAAPWSTLYASRLWATAAIRLPFEWAAVDHRDARHGVLRDDRVDDPEALAAAITKTMTSDATRALLRAWTTGVIRWRLGFARGHKRSIVWRVARDVTAAAPELINDPNESTWNIEVDEVAGTLELVPKRAVDPRYAWRVADIPAASHPSVAAALGWVAGIRGGERVWDPFCGSGAELVECAKRGATTIHGSDLDDTALAAARSNCDAAGIAATLTRADARTHSPGAVDVVITNPPLGSRVRVDAAKLLVDVLPHLVNQLAPGGRLVWISPTRRTTEVAERLGLRCSRSFAVDLGGVRGQLERWDLTLR